MPAETLSGGGASPDEIRRAVFDAIDEVRLVNQLTRVNESSTLVDIDLEGVALLDVIELVASDLGERALVSIDGIELDECRSVADLLWLCREHFGAGAGAGIEAGSSTGGEAVGVSAASMSPGGISVD